MIIDIWDVGHGACSLVTFPNGARILVDAGHRFDPFWAPSIEYFGQSIDLLVLQNLDEDHVANLPYVVQHVTVKGLMSNPTVTADALGFMKQTSGMGHGVKEAQRLFRLFSPMWHYIKDLGPTGWGHAFWNRYASDFFDSNNLSVPLFLGNGNFCILFGGDLEEAGWKALMRVPNFCQYLAKVKIFVASHHGRESGCCEDIFKFCKPDVVIISDYEHQHLSQQTANWYANRANGIIDNTVGNGLLGHRWRRVLSTRNDGSLRIVVEPNGKFTVLPNVLTPGKGLLSSPGWAG